MFIVLIHISVTKYKCSLVNTLWLKTGLYRINYRIFIVCDADATVMPLSSFLVYTKYMYF